MDVNPAFWRGKRVLVTGCTGFKGSWLCVVLHNLGARVSGFALAPPTQPSLFELANVASRMRFTQGDVRDAVAVTELLHFEKPEIVLHLAAQALVRRSYDEPAMTYDTNVLGTAVVLDALRGAPSVRAAVIVTSDKCYDLRLSLERYRETDRLGGHDPYSASKAAAEMVVAGFRSALVGHAATPAIATARSGNVIGGGDFALDRLMPDLIRAFADGQVALVRQPRAVRPWQHVLDPIHGYLMLAEQLCGDEGKKFAEAWNFGPPTANEQRVSELADEAAYVWGAGARWQIDTAQQPHEAASLRLDSTKAADRLGWAARVSLHEALQRTVAWHQAFVHGSNARELVDADLSALASYTVAS